jgi:hypothetical protein
VAAKDIPDAIPTLPPTPPRRDRKVIEIAAGAGGDAIQKAIDQAAKLTGQRPVVHLPMAAYKIEKTLVIPAGCDVQLALGRGRTGQLQGRDSPAAGASETCRILASRLSRHRVKSRSSATVTGEQTTRSAWTTGAAPGRRVMGDTVNVPLPSSRQSTLMTRLASATSVLSGICGSLTA